MWSALSPGSEKCAMRPGHCVHVRVPRVSPAPDHFTRLRRCHQSCLAPSSRLCLCPSSAPRASNHFVPPALPCCWYYPTLFTWNEGCYFDHLLHLDLNTLYFPKKLSSPKSSKQAPTPFPKTPTNDVQIESPFSSRFVISLAFN